MKAKTERNAEILWLWNDGVTCRDIAARFGMTFQRVHQITARGTVGGESEGRPPTNPAAKAAVIATAVRTSDAFAGRVWGVSGATVGRWRRQAGVSP